MDVYVYKKKELQLSYFSICEGKKLDDKIVTYFALKAGSTVHHPYIALHFDRKYFWVLFLLLIKLCNNVVLVIQN